MDKQIGIKILIAASKMEMRNVNVAFNDKLGAESITRAKP
jgi:hypothetical protein